MASLSLGLFLSPADVGIEKYHSAEIAELMKRIDPVDDDDLLGFARAVSSLFEEREVASLKGPGSWRGVESERGHGEPQDQTGNIPATPNPRT